MTEVTSGTGRLRIKVQLFCGAEPALGPGKAMLLEAIAAEGSISAAGRALGMSYRRAWLLVDGMNRCFVDRLVETTAGGGRDRGAKLTQAGRVALGAYRAMEADMAAAAEAGPLATLRGMLRDIPEERDGAAGEQRMDGGPTRLPSVLSEVEGRATSDPA